MNITRAQLHAQYKRAKQLDWIPFFIEAAEKVTKGFFDAADLMAIGSRESNLDPVWLTKPGDRGNGFGLMQADKRSFPNFTKSEAWKDPRKGIMFGAEVLMQKWHDNQEGIGRKRTVKGHSYVGKDIGQGLEAQRVTIAAYNNGRWPHYAVSHDRDPDSYTTGHDYSRDVMERAQAFREMLIQDGFMQKKEKPAPVAVADGQPGEPAPVIPSELPAAGSEIKTTEVVQSGGQTTATEVSQIVPKGDPPAAPAIKVTENGLFAKLLASGGLSAVGLFAWNYIQSNPSAVGIVAICVTALILALIFRGTITDAIRMQTAADPEKKNVT